MMRMCEPHLYVSITDKRELFGYLTPSFDIQDLNWGHFIVFLCTRTV